MCGLFGFNGNRYPDYNALKLMAIDAQVRGSHSTGVYGSKMWKTTDEARKAVYNDDFAEAIRAKTVIGHTRYATMGIHSVANAHPFEFKYDGGVIIGAHNGWLPEPEWQAMKHDLEMTTVDSQLIYEKLIKDNRNLWSLVTLEGAMALSFIMDGRLYLYKRESKPLFITQTGAGVYYSSRWEGLVLAGFKNIVPVPNHEILAFEKGVLVDHRFYGIPKIQMPEDCSPYQWRTNAIMGGKDEVIPHTYKADREVEEYNKKKNPSKYHRDFSTHGSEDTSQYSRSARKVNKRTIAKAKRNEEEVGDLINKIDEDFKGLKVHDVKSGDVFNTSFSDSDASYIVGVLKSAQTKEPLENWDLFLDVNPEKTHVVSSSRGIVLFKLNFDKDKGEKKRTVRMLAAPPGGNDAIYSKAVEVKSGSVLEVTLFALPFQNKDKEAKTTDDKSEQGKIPFDIEGGGQSSDIKAGKDGEQIFFYCKDETHKRALKHISALLKPIPRMEFSFEGGLRLQMSDYDFPFLASHLAQELIKSHSGTDVELYDEVERNLSDLEKTEWHFGESLPTLQDNLKTKYMDGAIKVYNAVIDARTALQGESEGKNGYLKGATSNILPRRESDTSWDALYLVLYRNLRYTLAWNSDLCEKAAEILGLESAGASKPKERGVSIEDMKNKEIGLLTNDGVFKLKSERAYIFALSASRILDNLVTDFWSLTWNPSNVHLEEDLISTSKSVADIIMAILQSITVIKIRIVSLKSQGFEFKASDIAALAKIENKLSTAQKELDKISRYSIRSVDDETFIRGNTEYIACDHGISSLYAPLLSLSTQLKNQLSGDELVQ
jgi:hypothetical protein